MPAAANLSINDATPTAHVFVPTAISSNLALFRNNADASISASAEQVGVSLSRANANRTTDKVKLTLSIPHEQTVDGAVQVRSTARFVGEWILPDDMSATERADFAALVKNAVADADIEDYVTDLEIFW